MNETITPIEMPQLLPDHHLKALHLPTMLREYDRVARQCAATTTRSVVGHACEPASQSSESSSLPSLPASARSMLAWLTRSEGPSITGRTARARQIGSMHS